MSQVGYLLIGLGLGTPAALASTVFYLFHNSVAKTGLLLATGLVRCRRGTDRLRELGGLVRSEPLLSVLFFITALALAGLPPFSGFWAKLLVLQAAVDGRAWTIAAVAAGVGLFTLLSMTKIWTTAFWGAVPAAAAGGPDETARRSGAVRRLLELGPVALLAAVAVALGLAAGPAIAVAERAAEGLLDPTAYAHALQREAP